MEKTKYKICIVSPAFNEQEVLPIFIQNLVNVLTDIKNIHGYKVVLVDDGSKDNTWDVIQSLNKQNKNITGIKLSKNFGHQNALLAGYMSLDIDEFDAIISMDSDMQQPPSVIPEIIERFAEGYNIVHTQRIKDVSELSFAKVISSKLFYKFINIFSNTHIIEASADFRLIDNKVFTLLKTNPPKDLFFRGYFPSLGFEQSILRFYPQNRAAGKSKYNWTKMFKLATTALKLHAPNLLNLSFFFAIGSIVLTFLLLIIGIIFPGVSNLLIILILSILFTMTQVSIGVIAFFMERLNRISSNEPLFVVSEETQIR